MESSPPAVPAAAHSSSPPVPDARPDEAPRTPAAAAPASASAPVRTAARRRYELPPLLPEQLLTGLATAFCLALADVALTVTASDAAWSARGGAALHLVALYLPVGLVVGAGSAAVVGLVRGTPWLQGLRRALSPQRWWASDPPAVAAVLGALSGLLAIAAVSYATYGLLATRTHRIDLAAAAMAGLSLAILLLGAVVAALVRRLLRRPLRWIAPLATLGNLVVGGLLLVVSLGAWVLLTQRSIVQAYGVPRLVLGPLAAVTLFGLTFLVRRALAGRRAWRAAGVAIAVTAVAWVGSGLTYQESNRVRSVVEQGSVLGRPLLRRYAWLADFDRDGHAWAFGGRDCDDFDARVHPGARDVPGDGVDADCFQGDGSPDVADLGNGVYGTAPLELGARPNFLLVTIDALRPDHLGVGGYERETSPRIDAFAEGAVVFDRALAQSSRSIRSIPAMMTGRYPSRIAYGPEYLYPALLERNRTLAEVLGSHGYDTAVTMGTNYFERVRGFFQGFDDVVQIAEYKPRRRVTVDRALTQLRRLGEQRRPFFLWVHLFNVHQPYLRPAATSVFGQAEVDHYDTEIQYADAEFGRLMEALTDQGLDERTVVVLASDHGEAFGEHGHSGHALSLYDEELLATLMVRAPGFPPARVAEPVGLLDFFPTVLNLADIRVPAPTPPRSLLPTLTGASSVDTERLLFAELMPDGMFPFDVKAIRRGSEKLLWWVQDGTFQLFDLETDPAEAEDLSDTRRDDALELLGLLQAWTAETHLADNVTTDFVSRHRLAAEPPNLSHNLDLSVPGAFEILGFDFEEREYHPGETIPLTFYYRVQGGTSLDLFFRVNVEGPPGYTVPPDFHAMHYPLRGRYRTPQWQPGEILRDPVPMVVPPHIEAPVDLRLTFSLQLRDQGLLRMTQQSRTVQTVTLAELPIRPAEEAAPRPRAPLVPVAPPPALRIPGAPVLGPAPVGGAGSERPWPPPPRDDEDGP